MDCSNLDYLWIIVRISPAVWTLVLMAPIHCRGSSFRKSLVGVKRWASVHSSGICSSSNHGDSKWHPPGIRLSFRLAVDNDVLPRVDDVILGGLMSYCGRLRHWSTETSVRTSISISHTHTHTPWHKPAQMHHLCRNWFCIKISKYIQVPSFSLSM